MQSLMEIAGQFKDFIWAVKFLAVSVLVLAAVVLAAAILVRSK